MSSIVEFLLARLAEDEKRGQSCRYWSECDEGYGCPAHMSTGRWVDEVEAKRRVVSLMNDTGWLGRHDVLKALALPYAAHEDYREEWRP